MRISDPCRLTDGVSCGPEFFVVNRARKCQLRIQITEEKIARVHYISQAGTAFSYHLLAEDQIVLINILKQ